MLHNDIVVNLAIKSHYGYDCLLKYIVTMERIKEPKHLRSLEADDIENWHASSGFTGAEQCKREKSVCFNVEVKVNLLVTDNRTKMSENV